MKIAFMGTADFAVPALDALAQAGHEIAAVYSRPPKPAGRGQKERRAPVHEAADRLGLMVRTPLTLKSEAEAAAFKALDLDAAVVAAYGHILTAPFLEAPIFGCINIHGSLLPRWRGAAPIQRAILAGDAQSGVTIIRMDAGLDTGPMLLAESVALSAATTTGQLHDTLAALGAKLVVAALDGLMRGSLTPVAQPQEGVTYAHKLGKDEGLLDWRRPAAELERAIRALNPWPGTFFEVVAPGSSTTERIKVLEGQLAAGAGPPGTVLAGEGTLIVACGTGALRVLRLQRPGRAPLAVGDFLRGFNLPPATRLPMGNVIRLRQP